ncbi:hypothetical protein PFDG_05507, partial [Plasmodium falciparum Dd2]
KVKPESWWNKHGPDIWNGMICALTYKESGDKKIEQVKTANSKLLDKLKKEDDGEYKYENVTFEGGFDESDCATEALLPDASPKGKTKLENFVKRPFFFRWLEEWGEEFCRKQKHKLEIIRVDCRGKDDDKNCSGDGLKCNEEVPENEKIYEGFHCPSCANSCRWYKKWIERKGKEFTEQKEAYAGQKGKFQTESDNGFCGKLKDDAAKFLENLGPCKNDSEEGKKIFEDNGDTFGPAKNCKPCSKFKIKCNGSDCSGPKENKCNGKNSIDANDIETMGNFTHDVDMLVSDNSTTESKGNGLKQACGSANIFKGIREDKWKCRNVCGVHICKRENEGDEKYIIMKELLKRWLEYFFEDYNKINAKISGCTKNGEVSKCIKDCVDKWITKKKDEWQKINDNYLRKYTEKYDDGNTLTNFLEQYQHLTEFQKAIKPCPTLDAFERSIHCNGTSILGNAKAEKKDIVLCLLKKLEDKANKCKEKHQTCTDTAQPKTPDDEEDLTLEEDEQNTVGKQQPS